MVPGDLMPALSAFEASLEMVGILVYVSIGLAAVGQAPRDERTRVFLLLAIINAIATAVPVLFWWLGISDAMSARRMPLAVMLASLAVASLALFHFAQILPRRRPWIRGSALQLPVAYALTPPVVILLVRMAPLKGEPASGAFMLLSIAFGFPLVVLLGLVLPIATIISFIRSFREALPSGVLPTFGRCWAAFS